MESFEFFVDSTADLPAELVDELRIHVIPYIFMLDGTEYLNYPDHRDLPVQDFYNKLREGKACTTMQITAHRYLEAWRPFLEDGRDILFLCLSGRLSRSYDQSILAAREAEETYPGRRVITIDSKSASLGEGLLAVKAARAKGKNLDELAAYIKELAPKVQHWIMADDLHHLRRGGRISGAKALVGTMLNVKPILTVADTGKLIPTEKTRGHKKALALFLGQLEKYAYRPGETMCIAHSDVPELAEQLRQMLADKGETDVIINDIGPVIGAHTGPGTVALVFIGDGPREVETE